jgi:hypothetical protein
MDVRYTLSELKGIFRLFNEALACPPRKVKSTGRSDIDDIIVFNSEKVVE